MDFNTGILRLRRGAPKDFNTIYLDIFKSKVLFPMFKRAFGLIRKYPNWLKNQLVIMNTDLRSEFYEFDRYDLRNAFDLVIGSHSRFPNEVETLIKSYIKDMGSESLKALFYFSFDERV